MLVVLAAVVTTVCTLAALLRLACVVEATPFDPIYLSVALGEPSVRRTRDLPGRIGAGTRSVAGSEWEQSVVDALVGPIDARAALLGEALTELEFRARRWGRVPRVCASLTSSFGFLLATAALRAGLSDVSGTTGDAAVLTGAAFDAVDVMAVGLVGTAFCIAALYRSRAAAAARLSGAERLVDVLERVLPGDGRALATAEPRASVDALDSFRAHSPQIA